MLSTLPSNSLTCLDQMLNCAINLNGLHIPLKSVEGTLSSYTHPLIVWNHDDTHSCSLMGSGVGIHYRNQYLLLCTRHQLKALNGRSYEDVGMLDEDGSSFCSAAGIRHYLDHMNEVDLHDLAVFDFTEPCESRPQMKNRFFNLETLPPDVQSDHVIGFTVSGYPSERQAYDLTEKERHLGFCRASVTCGLAPYAEQTEDPTILRIAPLSPLRFDPDGMSGGAAFVMQFVDGVPCAYLAGMVLRGGTNSFSILKIGFIKKFIEAWLSHDHYLQQLSETP